MVLLGVTPCFVVLIHGAMHEARCSDNIALKFISLKFICCTITNKTTKVLFTQPIAKSHNVLYHLLCCCNLGCGLLSIAGQNETTNGGACTSLLRLEMSGVHLEVPRILATTKWVGSFSLAFATKRSELHTPLTALLT